MKLLPDETTYRAFSRPELRAAAQDLVAAIAVAIAGEQRECDDWEAFHLLSAMGLINGGMNVAALHAADKALAPPETRADEPWRKASCAISPAEILKILHSLRAADLP